MNFNNLKAVSCCSIKKILILLPIVFCSGCIFQNPYKTFYHDRTGGIDITKCPAVKLPAEEPKIILGSDVAEDTQKMRENGYELLGISSFNAGDDVSRDDLLAQAKNVKAEIALSYSRYTHTNSGVVPWIIPDNHTINTTYSGTGNYQGNIYGSNGGWASYNGTSNTYGQANTTIYGSQTIYLPYSHNRYDYFASYWIKLTDPIFGVLATDLTPEQRAIIGTNKGACVTIVIKDSPAFMEDILKGDIITKINDDEVIDTKNLQTLESKYFGKKVRVTIIRDEKTLIKEIQFLEGERIFDEKYGNTAKAYYMFCNSAIGLTKTASIHFDKIFDSYHKNKEYGFTFEECRRNEDKAYDPKAIAAFDTIQNTISNYGKKNQYRAIFSFKLPNINEDEDLTDKIILILNTEK